MIKPIQSTHWYTLEGVPAYEADLRDARKLGLAPSVTSIIGMLDKPGITAWKVNTMLECAYTEPTDGRDFDAWRSNVESTWQKETTRAAKLGTDMHKYAEDCINGLEPEPIADQEGLSKNFSFWVSSKLDDAETERAFCSHTSGGRFYGGRIDCVANVMGEGLTVIDFKTQFVKNGKPTYYPEWLYQLSAYRHAVINAEKYTERVGCASVVLDTNSGEVFVKHYTDVDVACAFETFAAMTELFYILKKL